MLAYPIFVWIIAIVCAIIATKESGIHIDYGVDVMSYTWHIIPSVMIEVCRFEPKFRRMLVFGFLLLKYSVYLEIEI